MKNCDKCGADLPPGHKMEEVKDVVVTPKLLHLNGSEGLEGDRSNCCLALAERSGEDGETTCTKCKKTCGLLTEEEKVAINKKATEAINDLMEEDVTVTVIYKLNNENIKRKVKLPQVRVFAEEAAKKYLQVWGMDPEAPDNLKNFVLVEYYHKSGDTKVTALLK